MFLPTKCLHPKGDTKPPELVTINVSIFVAMYRDMVLYMHVVFFGYLFACLWVGLIGVIPLSIIRF